MKEKKRMKLRVCFLMFIILFHSLAAMDHLYVTRIGKQCTENEYEITETYEKVVFGMYIKASRRCYKDSGHTNFEAKLFRNEWHSFTEEVLDDPQQVYEDLKYLHTWYNKHEYAWYKKMKVEKG